MFPYLIKKTNTYVSITKNHINKTFLTLYKKHYWATPQKKGDLRSRWSRIIQLGHGAVWSTFITLTFAPDYYWDDYDIIQSQYRAFIKSLYYKIGSFKYLAVLEHGGKTGRIHYHMLSTIPWASSIFEHAFHTKRKVCNLWDYGFSDVVKVKNDKCNAVFYLCKYLSKNNKNRTPIGKREVFSSRGLSAVEVVETFDESVVNSYLENMVEYVTIGRSTIYIKQKEKNA